MKTISLVSLIGALASLLVACSSEEAAAPSRPPIPPPADTTSDGGSSGANADGGPTKDCFDATKSKPADTKQFLNQCNGGECFAFDNAKRIEGFTAGAPLPPLN